MQSLRTGRTTNRLNRLPPKARSAAANARKSTVDDKIKKRMSMRYADPAVDLTIPAVPSLPTTVEQHDEQSSLVGEERGDSLDADKKVLEAEDFDPDAYLKSKLANSTEAEIRSLQSSLRGTKDDTSTELQRNVFKNYAELVFISKEISTLENEMFQLRESLAEWKNMPSLLHIDESASVAERRRNARSSVADLRILYANQMQTLHSQIEGSAKFAPTTPGRHIIIEMDGIFSLNAATYKVDHVVRFVLLDDAVLVARRRRRNAGGAGGGSADGGKLVAEKCWPLSEMLVLDTKDTSSMTNVFKVRHGKETHVYRTETSADKKSILSQFRAVAEELAAKKRKEREGEHERRKTLWAGGGGKDDIPAMPDWMSELAQKAPGDGTTAKSKDELTSRWVGEFADDLTVAIALREWDKAVTLVEQGKEKLSTIPSLSPKLAALTASLTSSLLTSLSLPTHRKSTVTHLISLLLRLGAGAAARTTFLDMREGVLRKCVRAIRFEGHVGMFVSDLAMCVFMGVKHTADWFLASFKENEVASCFIDWAKKQIERYAEIFRSQVYTSDVEQKTVDEALRITYSQSKKLLQEYGLDFRFLLDQLLVKAPRPRASAHSTHIISVDDLKRASATSQAPKAPTPTPTSPSPQTRTRTLSASRSRTPNLAPPLPVPIPIPITPASSSGGRSMTPVTAASSPSSMDASTAVQPRLRPPRTPPPRSRDRPPSSARSAAVAVQRREGMF